MTTKQTEWFDLQTECFQCLQKILVDSGLQNEALVVAEAARSRPMADLQFERLVASSNPESMRVSSVCKSFIRNALKCREAVVRLSERVMTKMNEN
jgi:hypothetical protein